MIGDKESCVGVGKIRGREILGRFESSLFVSFGRRSSLLIRLLIFYFRNSLGCLIFDELLVRDLCMKSVLGFDFRWWFEVSSIDFAFLLVFRRVRKLLFGVRVMVVFGISWWYRNAGCILFFCFFVFVVVVVVFGIY